LCNTCVASAAAQCKVGRYIGATNTGRSNIVGANGLATVAQLSPEFRPYYVQSGKVTIFLASVCHRYFVNVERGNPAAKLQPRNKNVQNNSNVPMDLMVFIFYFDESVIDVETGIVTK
jgi:hypothetical protein